MSKLYRLIVSVIDFEGHDDSEINALITDNRYLSVEVLHRLSTELDWDDDHVLNKLGSGLKEVDEFFPELVKENVNKEIQDLRNDLSDVIKSKKELENKVSELEKQLDKYNKLDGILNKHYNS